MEAAENAKAAGVAANAAEQTRHYADKKLRTLSTHICNLKAKVKREQGAQADQELLRKLIQERKEYKEAPH